MHFLLTCGLKPSRPYAEVDPQFKLARFDRRRTITLPASCRSFVTTAGDGGTGPSTGCTTVFTETRAMMGRIH